MRQYENMRENGNGCDYFTNKCKGWGDGSVSKVLVHKCEDVGLTSQTHIALGGSDRQIPVVHWPASLAVRDSVSHKGER